MEQSKDTLKVGDTVLWRGGFGSEPAQEATVAKIVLVDEGKRELAQVGEIAWGMVDTRLVIVDLANGRWAYGAQIAALLTDQEAMAEVARRA